MLGSASDRDGEEFQRGVWNKESLMSGEREFEIK